MQQLDKITEPTCATLLLLAFIKITITGDLSHLGPVADPELTWYNIHSEYCELSGDAQSSRGLELAKQIAYLTNRINITNSIVTYLAERGEVISDLTDLLKQMGYRLSYTDLMKDLQRTITMSKSDHVKLANAKMQYEKLSTGDKTSEMDWYELLAALAKHRQVTVINPSNITVMEFIAMDKEFRAYVNAMRKVNK